MMKLIVPTDFTVKSLQAVRAAMQVFPDEQLQIVLLHLMRISNDPLELMMQPRERPYLRLFTETYRNEVEHIRRHSDGQIDSIYTDFLYMGIDRLLHDYVERHNIDAVVLAKGLVLTKPTPYSLDAGSVLQKAKVPVLQPELPVATIKPLQKPVQKIEDMDAAAMRYQIAFG